MIPLILSITFTSTVFSQIIAKDWHLPSIIQGQSPLTAAELENQPTLLQFWASWCVGCGDNMLTVENFQKKNPDLRFRYALVNLDSSIDLAAQYFKIKPKLKHFQTMTYFDDGSAFAEKMKLRSIPALFVVSKDRKVVQSLYGHIGPKEIQRLKSLLSKR